MSRRPPEKMEHDHRRRRVHQLQPVHARDHGRICRQRLARLLEADAEARPQVDQHPAEGARASHRPIADDRHRLRADHVQPVRRRALRRQGRRRRDQARRRHRADRSGQGEGPQGPGRRLSLRPHLVERRAPGAAGVQFRRPPDRPGLAADPRPPVVPDRRDARDPGRRRGDGAHGASDERPRGDAARARHQAARLLPQPLALLEMLHRRLDLGGSERRRRLRRRRDRAAHPQRRSRSRESTSDNYGDFKFDRLDENSGAYVVEIEAQGRKKKTVEAKLGVSINLGEIRL